MNAGDIEPLSAAESHPERMIRKLASVQHGNVGREQLLALGIGRHRIRRLVRVGHLDRVHAGVYRVGPARTPTGAGGSRR